MISSFQFVPFITALLVSAIFVWVTRLSAPRIGLLDHPSGRKHHDGAVPLVGGITIFFGAWVALWMVLGSFQGFWPPLLATLLILVVGVLDDRFELAVRPRLLVQTIAVLIMTFGAQFSLGSLGDLLGVGAIQLGFWWGLPLTLIAVVGVINALNLMDGIDGLAGSIAMLTLGVMGVLAWGGGRMVEAWVALLFCVAIIPYLLCNLGVCGRKRRIFLGDAGSMLLGFLIVWEAIALSQPAPQRGIEPLFAPVTALWLFAIPLVDTVAIMVRRLSKGQSPFLPDRDHLHHIVMRMGFRDRHALLFIVVASAVLAGLGLWMEFSGVAESLRFLLFLAFAVGYTLLLMHIWRVLRGLKQVVGGIRRGVSWLFSPLIQLPPRWKQGVMLLVDGGVIYGALATALFFRFGSWEAIPRYYDGPLGLALWAAPLVAWPLFSWFGLYRAVIRYFGMQALWAVVGAVVFYTLLYSGGWVLLRVSGAITGLQPLPSTVMVVHGVCVLLGVGGLRMLARWLLNQGQGARYKVQGGARRRCLVFGAGDAGRQLAGGLEESGLFQVCGFVEDAPGLQGRALLGRPILSSGEVGQFIEQRQVTDLLLPEGEGSYRDVQGETEGEVESVDLEPLRALPLRIRKVPLLDQIAGRQLQWEALAPLALEDLLHYPASPVGKAALQQIHQTLHRQTLLVVGADGVVGEALCQQILRHRPKLLLLYAEDSERLHHLHQQLLTQLRWMEQQGGSGAAAAEGMEGGVGSVDRDSVGSGTIRLVPGVIPLLGSVRDEQRLSEVIQTWHPQWLWLIPQGGAKQVLEHNPLEGIKGQLLPILSIARVAIEQGVPHLLTVSPAGKQPPTTLSAAITQLREVLLSAMGRSREIRFEPLQQPATTVTNKTRIRLLKMPRLLHTSDPTLSQIQQQIDQGGPIQLNDEQHHYLTPSELAQQLLGAALQVKSADCVVNLAEQLAQSSHDGGLKIPSIENLARQLVELAGKTVRDPQHPDGEIEIQIEKSTPLPSYKEQSTIPSTIPWERLQPKLNTLQIAAENGDLELIMTLIHELVPQYQPTEPMMDWVYREQLATNKTGSNLLY